MKVIHLCIVFIQAWTISLPTYASENFDKSMLVYTRFRGDLDPAKVFNPFEESLLRCTFQSLVKLDSTGRIIGDLAESWTISKDKKSAVFVLREAKFSDGTKVSSDDVVRSFKRLLQPDSTFLQKQILRELVGNSKDWVKATGNRTVQITLRKSYSPLLLLLTSFEYLIVPSRNGGFKNGSGKFNIEILETNKRFLIRNKHVDIKPQLVEVSFDLPRITHALESKEFRIVAGVPTFHAASVGAHSDFLKIAGNRYSPYMLELNHTKPLFRDPELRHAIKGLINNIARNIQTSDKSFLSYSDTFVSPGLLPPKYYERAQKPKVDPTTIKAKWGKKIDEHGIKIWLPQHSFPREFTENVRDTLQKVSDNIQILEVEYKDIKQRFERGEIDITGLDPSSYFPDPDSFLYLWQSNRPPFPFPGERLLEHLKEYRNLVDNKVRLAKYAELIEKFEREDWIIPLFRMKYPIFALKEVELPDANLTTFNLLCR